VATGQTLLDTMEVMDRGLQLQSGETGVTLALRALNASQDHFESMMALHPNVMGSSVGTVTTTASTETTAYPTGLTRLDRLQFIDPDTSRPAWDLDRIGPVGDHYSSSGSVYAQSETTGRPARYWTNGVNFYWDPLPNGTHTIRYYGMKAASDITAAGTFAYPDIVMMPIMQFAVRMLRIGKDDESGPVVDLGMQVFGPVIQSMTRFNRDRVPGYDYRYLHTE
jgi:hypothetical protein